MTVNPSSTRPWKRAVVWLAFLGPFFFASYGFANWLASRRGGVPSIVYPWEHAIPLLPWTIVPYWSIDFLYAISLFLCTTRRELDRHCRRLFFAQCVSITFFIAFPLRFSFPRPEAHGVFGALFTALVSFDKPFNQAPSLHIAILILLWVVYARHVPPRWHWLLHAWMALIGVSVLTTWQHHFFDIPTGGAVGFLALWLLPEKDSGWSAGILPAGEAASCRLDAAAGSRRPSRLEGGAPLLTTDPIRRRIAVFYTVAAIAFALAAVQGGIWLWLAWVATALALVAWNYAVAGAAGFQKQRNGRLSVGAYGLLVPYLAGAWLNSRLWTWRGAAATEIADGVSIGRIPTWREFAATPFLALVDVVAELPCRVRGARFYRAIPILDLTVPPPAALKAAAEAIEEARAHGPVLVCCALGYSRSAAVIVAWLLITGRAPSVEAAVDLLRSARPTVILKQEHRVALEGMV